MAKVSTTILSLSTIKKYLLSADLISLIQEGFVSFSSGNAVVPPVGELIFDNPKGEVHIKYGYIKHQPYYVVKIASGFYGNPKLGIKASQGTMLLFSQQTGELLENAQAFKNKFKDSDFSIEIASTIDQLTEKCNVIITATPSTQPLLAAHQIKAGTHITASNENQITVADLTGVAVQDIMIATAIFNHHKNLNNEN